MKQQVESCDGYVFSYYPINTCDLFFKLLFKIVKRSSKRLTWRAFSLAVAHEEEFSLAVAEKVANGFLGQFCRSNTFEPNWVLTLF